MGFFSPKNTPENAVKAQIDAKLAFINDKYTGDRQICQAQNG